MTRSHHELRKAALIAKLNECLIELDAMGFARAAISIDDAIIRLGGTPDSTIMLAESDAVVLDLSVAHGRASPLVN